MQHINTKGIVLKRTEFGEADRIVTMLTPQYGKITVLAKGVRRVKSKLAGGIELFSTNDVVYIPGKSDIKTLRSARMDQAFNNIVTMLDRTQAGYSYIKLLNSQTEAACEPEYYELLRIALDSLNSVDLPLPIIECWLRLQLLNQAGHMPNLTEDDKGEKLDPAAHYAFVMDDGHLQPSSQGTLDASAIKYARLNYQLLPSQLRRIENGEALATSWLRYLPLS